MVSYLHQANLTRMSSYKIITYFAGKKLPRAKFNSSIWYLISTYQPHLELRVKLIYKIVLINEINPRLCGG